MNPQQGKRAKLFKIIAILSGLLVVMLIISWLSGDDTSQQELQAIYINNQELIAASEIARTKASNYQLQATAGSLASTTASEQNELQAYFTQEYGTKLAAPENSKPRAFEDLKETTAGSAFDSDYLEIVRPLIKDNLSQIEALKDTNDPDLKQLLNTIEHNQTSYQQTLDKLSQ